MTTEARTLTPPYSRATPAATAPIWVAFSFFVGIVAAALHFVLLWMTALFGRATVPACLYAAVCIAALSVWCARGGLRPRVDSFLAGVMASGALFAILLVLWLLTHGLLALPFVVIPVLCVWIYGRNALRAFASAPLGTARVSAGVAGLLAAPSLTAITLFAAVWCSNIALVRLLSNDPKSATPWIEACAPLIRSSELPGWTAAYDAEASKNTEESRARAERLSLAHQRITGLSLPIDWD